MDLVQKPNSTRPLLIRADAAAEMGTGHVMRCLALAQAWQDAGGSVVFSLATMPEALEERLRVEGVEVRNEKIRPGTPEDAASTVRQARTAGADWVVVDGYQFGAEFQESLKESGLRVLFVDDFGHAQRYTADIVLNQNLNADAALYRNRGASTRLLLGTRYALLRREFARWRGWTRTIPETARKVLVTMGGSDPRGLTIVALEALCAIPGAEGIEVVAVVGGADAHREMLEKAGAEGPIQLRIEGNSTRMAELMAWADMAIAAAGSTIWEMAFMGLPAIIAVAAENQRSNAEMLDASGAAINLGWHGQVHAADAASQIGAVMRDPQLRHRLREKCTRLVDGKGTERVLRWVKRQQLGLRRAAAGDARLLWAWANETEVRAASFSTAPIPWEVHYAWFSEKLADPATFLYVAMDNGEPVGQLRFQLEGDTATVSVSVAGEHRGEGYGKDLLYQGTERFFVDSKARVIHAYIKPFNVSSKRAFLNAGYEVAGKTTVQGQEAILLVKERRLG